MKSILFYIYIKEIIGRIMNIYTLKENMRRFRTKNVLFEQKMTPEAEAHWAKYPMPEDAEEGFRSFVNKHPDNKAKFGPGTDFDIDPVKPASQPPLNDFIKLAWYEIFKNQNLLFKNMMKNDFAMIKPKPVAPAKPKTVLLKSYDVMDIRKPGPLAKGAQPENNPTQLTVKEYGFIDPVTQKQRVTRYSVIGTQGFKKINSHFGDIVWSKQNKYWVWNQSVDIGNNNFAGVNILGKLGFSRNVGGDDPNKTSTLGGHQNMPDPQKGGILFYGIDDQRWAIRMKNGIKSYLRGIDTGNKDVNAKLVSAVGSLINSNWVKNAISTAEIKT